MCGGGLGELLKSLVPLVFSWPVTCSPCPRTLSVPTSLSALSHCMQKRYKSLLCRLLSGSKGEKWEGDRVWEGWMGASSRTHCVCHSGVHRVLDSLRPRDCQEEAWSSAIHSY